MSERRVTKHVLLASAERGAGTGYSNAINASEYETAMFYMDATAHAGTSPLLDLTMQVSHDNSAWYYTASVFTQTTDEASRMLAATSLGYYVRFKYIIAGTDTPKYTFYLVGVFKT